MLGELLRRWEAARVDEGEVQEEFDDMLKAEEDRKLEIEEKIKRARLEEEVRETASRRGG